MQTDEASLNAKIEIWEKSFGILSEKFPYNYCLYICYSTPHARNLIIKIYPEGEYEAEYRYNMEKSWVYTSFKAKGTYNYSPQEKILTLEANSLEVNNKNFDDTLHESMLPLVDQTFRKVNIHNYYWGSIELQVPTIIIPGTDEKKANSKDAVVIQVPAKLEDFLNTSLYADLQPLFILEKIQESGKSPIDFISEAIEYGDLTLHPDGTLIYNYRFQTCYDDLNSHCAVCKVEGNWEFDRISRTMTLIYEKFYMSENGEEINSSSFELPKLHVIKNFYFEGEFIKSFHPKLNPCFKFSGFEDHVLKKREKA